MAIMESQDELVERARLLLDVIEEKAQEFSNITNTSVELIFHAPGGSVSWVKTVEPETKEGGN